MTRRRFYAPREVFVLQGARIVLSAEESRHLRDVLRLRAGDVVTVFDGEGREFECAVVEPGGRGGATLEVGEQVEPPAPESPVFLMLAVALLKGEKFDLVVQKATELGVRRIEPLLTKRSDVRLRDEKDAERRVERWRRLALEAAKQSGRATVPTVTFPIPFDEYVALEPPPESLRLMFVERGGAALETIRRPESGRTPAVVAVTGPEGGWDEEEVALAREQGWATVTLGGRILRAETAAIVVSALLQHTFGDLR